MSKPTIEALMADNARLAARAKLAVQQCNEMGARLRKAEKLAAPAIKPTRVVQEEFEAWAHKCLFDLDAGEDGYTSAETHAAWNAWVGSRAVALLSPKDAA